MAFCNCKSRHFNRKMHEPTQQFSNAATAKTPCYTYLHHRPLSLRGQSCLNSPANLITKPLANYIFFDQTTGMDVIHLNFQSGQPA